MLGYHYPVNALNDSKILILRWSSIEIMLTEKEYETMSREKAFVRLPKELQEFIRQTTRPFVRIKAELSEVELPLTASKFGGLPFIPKGKDCPRNEDGYPHQLLAQINFSEVTEQALHLPELPESGLLQFFIPVFDPEEMYGIEDKTYQIRFLEDEELSLPVADKTINELRKWYEELLHYKRDEEVAFEESDHNRDIGFEKKYGATNQPLYTECTLSFISDKAGMCEGSECDYNDIRTFLEKGKELFYCSTENELLYSKATSMEIHHMLGYPQVYLGEEFELNFEDRFLAEKEGRHMVRFDPLVLLAIDSQRSDEPIHGWGKWKWLICFGDADPVHFTITKKDLENRDFSNVKLILSRY